MVRELDLDLVQVGQRIANVEGGLQEPWVSTCVFRALLNAPWSLGRPAASADCFQKAACATRDSRLCSLG